MYRASRLLVKIFVPISLNDYFHLILIKCATIHFLKHLELGDSKFLLYDFLKAVLKFNFHAIGFAYFKYKYIVSP